MVVWNFKIYNIFNNVVELFSFSHLLSVNIVLHAMKGFQQDSSKRNNPSI